MAICRPRVCPFRLSEAKAIGAKCICLSLSYPTICAFRQATSTPLCHTVLCSSSMLRIACDVAAAPEMAWFAKG